MSDFDLTAATAAGSHALADHDYDVELPTFVSKCLCGWKGKTGGSVAEFDRHVATAILVAALPHICEALAHEASERLKHAAYLVDSKHHFHGTTCSCGFWGDARKRTQTEHITTAVITELRNLEAAALVGGETA